MLYIWKHIFDQIQSDKTQPLTYEELRDPSRKLVKNLLYIYSMETPLVYSLNAASREQDSSKVSTLGPFSRALYRIVVNAEKNRNKDNESMKGKTTYLYRGLKMTQVQIDEYKQYINSKDRI